MPSVLKCVGFFFLLSPELKAEVEKLRAAQMSTQGIEPEEMRLFQQEFATLKSQLTQQEKEMLEAHRSAEQPCTTSTST